MTSALLHAGPGPASVRAGDGGAAHPQRRPPPRDAVGEERGYSRVRRAPVEAAGGPPASAPWRPAAGPAGPGPPAAGPPAAALPDPEAEAVGAGRRRGRVRARGRPASLAGLPRVVTPCVSALRARAQSRRRAPPARLLQRMRRRRRRLPRGQDVLGGQAEGGRVGPGFLVGRRGRACVSGRRRMRRRGRGKHVGRSVAPKRLRLRALSVLS